MISISLYIYIRRVRHTSRECAANLCFFCVVDFFSICLKKFNYLVSFICNDLSVVFEPLKRLVLKKGTQIKQAKILLFWFLKPSLWIGIWILKLFDQILISNRLLLAICSNFQMLVRVLVWFFNDKTEKKALSRL